MQIFYLQQQKNETICCLRLKQNNNKQSFESLQSAEYYSNTFYAFFSFLILTSCGEDSRLEKLITA